MKPWFRGFKGRVYKEDTGHLDHGGCVQGQWSGLKVTELPPGRWTQDYKEYLDTLVEKKLIGGFTNNSTTEDVDFEIFRIHWEGLVKDLKMKKTFHTSNMHLFHPQGYLQVLES
jgi:DNA topoisomerase II